MHKETLEIYNRPFLKKIKIKPFPLDIDQVDTDPKFQDKLFKSLMKGWQKDASLIIAYSEDETIDGLPIQGLNRILILERVLKHNPRYDLSQIQVRFEECKSWEQYKSKRAQYEILATLSKDPTVSKHIIRKNLADVLKAHYDKDQRKVTEYFATELGFTDHEILAEIYEDYADKLEKKASRNKKPSRQPFRQQSTLPAHLQDRKNWGVGQDDAPVVEDDATTYLREVPVKCEHCSRITRAKINLILSDDRKTFKLLPAQLAVSK